MRCGVMVTGYNQGDWERLLAEDYSRPPAVSDAANMDDTLYLGELVEPLGFDSIWATEHYGSAYSMQPNPLQYLAYWVGRTARVDVGTADAKRHQELWGTDLSREATKPRRDGRPARTATPGSP